MTEPLLSRSVLTPADTCPTCGYIVWPGAPCRFCQRGTTSAPSQENAEPAPSVVLPSTPRLHGEDGAGLHPRFWQPAGNAGNPCQGDISTPGFAGAFISGDTKTRINSGIAESYLVKWGMQPPKTQVLIHDCSTWPTIPRTALGFEHDDGGRAAAGFKGEAGDCGTRAIAIAAQKPYREVYDALAALAGRSCRDGTPRKATDAYLASLGWGWTPTMGIGTGCTVHLKYDELPAGRLVCRVSKHWVAVVDGVMHDTHRCDREGTRCVYGFWIKP